MKKSTEQLKEIDLFSLPNFPDIINRCNKLLVKQNGKVIMLIHPFFHQIIMNRFEDCTTAEIVQILLTQHTDSYFYPRNLHQTGFGRTKRAENVTEINAISYYQRLEKLLKHSQTLFLLLGEYTPYVPLSIALIRAFGFSGHILLYETQNGEPIPKEDLGSWETLAKSIQLLDFSKLVVAGQLTGHTTIQNMSKIPHGCVPIFAEEMSKRLDIHKEIIISPVTYPHWWTKNDEYPYFRSKKK